MKKALKGIFSIFIAGMMISLFTACSNGSDSGSNATDSSTSNSTGSPTSSDSDLADIKNDIEVNICSFVKAYGADKTAKAFKPSTTPPKSDTKTAVIIKNKVWNAVIWLEGTTIYYYADGLTNKNKKIPLGENQAKEMFYQCVSLEEIDLSGFDTKKIKNMYRMFSYCENLILLNITSFNTTNVTNMNSMFYGCKSLKSINISNFDTSNVTDMNSMFGLCPSLISVDISNFNTSNVTDMSCMFSDDKSLKTLDVSHFDTSNVTNMSCMFKNNNNLQELDVSKFNTNNVTDMDSMFSGCSALKILNVKNFDTSKVTNMHHMFGHCSSVESLDVGHFNTASIIDSDKTGSDGIAGMFQSCSSLVNLNLGTFDTKKIVDFRGLFVQCESLEIIDISNFKLNPEASTINTCNMFGGCKKLKTIYASNDADWDKARDNSVGGWMFAACNSLVGGNGTAYASEGDNKYKAIYACVDGINGKKGYFTAK